MGFVPRVSEEFNRSVAVLPRVARSERLRDNGIHLPEGKRHRVSARCRLFCPADSPISIKARTGLLTKGVGAVWVYSGAPGK